jgi:Domain of unknown function (DUF4252)
MTVTSRRRLWLNLALASAVVWATLPGLAQSAKLELKNLEKLNGKAAEVNDVTLEGQLLELAWKFIEADHDPEAAQLKEVLKGLKGIYIKNFEFDEPDQYSQADVDAIRAQLASPGWTRIVESRSRRSREHDEIYVMKQGDNIAGLVVLVAETRELTVVNIVGNIDVNKLSLLEGHFGIPDEEGGHPKRKHKNDDARPAKDREKDKNHDKTQADMEDSDDDN